MKTACTLRTSAVKFLIDKLEVAYLMKKYTQTYDTAIFIPFLSQNPYTEPAHSFTFLHIPTHSYTFPQLCL